MSNDGIFFYIGEGQKRGPCSFAQLRTLAMSGQLRPEDLVWKQGTPDWVKGQAIAGLFQAAVTPPPLAPGSKRTSPSPEEPDGLARSVEFEEGRVHDEKSMGFFAKVKARSRCSVCGKGLTLAQVREFNKNPSVARRCSKCQLWRLD